MTHEDKKSDRIFDPYQSTITVCLNYLISLLIHFLAYTFFGSCKFTLKSYCNDPKFLDRYAWANSADPDRSSLIRVYTVCLLSKKSGISIYRENCFSRFTINAASQPLFWVSERGPAWLQKYWLMNKIAEILFCSSFGLWKAQLCPSTKWFICERTNYLLNDKLFVNLSKDKFLWPNIPGLCKEKSEYPATGHGYKCWCCGALAAISLMTDNTSWLLKKPSKYGRLPLLETISSLSSARCAPFWGKVSGVTGKLHGCDWNLSPDVTDSFTWRYWTVSPDVTGPYHLRLLNRITWCYWTVWPGVTGPYHLTLLGSFTCHYWTYRTVSPCVTETYHLTLQDSNRAVQYATTNSLICDCFLK